ncbi:MAG: glycosyltransferase, partial [Acidimicrobiales bacterium]
VFASLHPQGSAPPAKVRSSSRVVPLSYVLPLRRDRVGDIAELAAYTAELASHVELLVVDGSPPPVFAAHQAALSYHPAQGAARAQGVQHLAPDACYHFANGKVDGVLTGLRRCTHDAVVVADDDVRWDRSALARVAELLADADVVRPQNYFDPLPWHARWDTARSLLNRALGADWPGTVGVRRSVLLGTGGYDGDAMFENLELVRTVEAAGGTVASPLDLYVRRLPPTTRQFLGQRVRQAYDDFAQPPRLVVSLAVLPLAVVALRRRPRAVLAAAAASVAVAERGRRRAGGKAVFPASCSWFAPLWVAERAVCSWLAVQSRWRWGGIRYRGRVLPLAAHSERQLCRRVRPSASSPTSAPSAAPTT